MAQGYGDNKQPVRFTIAVNNFGDRPASFVDCTAFNGLAEKVVLPHVKKGAQVFIQARVETRMVEDRGENRQRVGFVVESLRLGSNGSGGGGGSTGGSAPDEEPPPF